VIGDEPFVNVRRPAADAPHACPCCGYLTPAERGWCEICPVCCWEDDGQYGHDADTVRGGPNGKLSLSAARRDFADCGASSRRRLALVRAPDPRSIR
jgi:hypothetical protein